MDRCSIPELNFGTKYRIVCIRNDDAVWIENVPNLVVNTGLEYAMGRIFGTLDQKSMYMGLCTDTTVSPTDTAETHSFVEFMGTVNAYRPVAEFSDSGLAPGFDNRYTYTAPSVQVMIGSGDTLKGVFLTTEELKGSDTGTLYGVAPFSVDRVVVPGDALLTTITVSAQG